MKLTKEIITIIKKRLKIQKKDIESDKWSNMDNEIAKNIIFQENDVVEQTLAEYNIREEYIDLENLRNLQHKMLNSLEIN